MMTEERLQEIDAVAARSEAATPETRALVRAVEDLAREVRRLGLIVASEQPLRALGVEP